MATNHPFERAALGIAPFRYVGYAELTFQAHPGAPVQPGGSCDYCGQGIRHSFRIRSADGREFKVGSDCVAKTCQPGGPIVTSVQQATKKAQKEQAAARLAERVAAAKAKLAADPALLTDQPHPNAYWASKGETLRNSIVFLIERAGAAGQTKGCKAVERAA